MRRRADRCELSLPASDNRKDRATSVQLTLPAAAGTLAYGSNSSVLPGSAPLGGAYLSQPSAPSTSHAQSRRIDCTTRSESVCTCVGAMLSLACALSRATFR